LGHHENTKSTEKGEEIQTKGIDNLIAKNFPNLPKQKPGSRSLQNTTSSRPKKKHIIIKTLNIQNKERILKATKQKRQITYNGEPIRILADF
jgi:hypothetical protein